MSDGPFAARPPRPVAGVPPPSLADGREVAKGWLLGLLAAAPLEAAAAVPAGDLVADGPALCAALLRAVGSNEDLERLRAGHVPPAATAGRLAGAASPPAAAAAVARLRDAAWTALAAQAGPLDGPATAALAARLAHVCDVITARVLDERPPDAPGALRALEADLRASEEPWIVAIERRLAPAGAVQPAFAVLVVEAADADRLRAAGGEEAAAALGRVEQAVRAEVRPADAVVRERAGRLWVIAQGLEAAGARALGGRLAEAVGAGAAHRGVPLTVAIGAACCPSDATDARALATRAEEGLFAARAAGAPLA
jgi:GGDEF domain-containing protein